MGDLVVLTGRSKVNTLLFLGLKSPNHYKNLTGLMLKIRLYHFIADANWRNYYCMVEPRNQLWNEMCKNSNIILRLIDNIVLLNLSTTFGLMLNARIRITALMINDLVNVLRLLS